MAAGSVAPGYREAGSDSARPRGGSSLLLAMVGSSGPLSPSRFVWAQTLYLVMTGVNLSETGSPNYTCRHRFMVLISADERRGVSSGFLRTAARGSALGKHTCMIILSEAANQNAARLTGQAMGTTTSEASPSSRTLPASPQPRDRGSTFSGSRAVSVTCAGGLCAGVPSGGSGREPPHSPRRQRGRGRWAPSGLSASGAVCCLLRPLGAGTVPDAAGQRGSCMPHGPWGPVSDL